MLPSPQMRIPHLLLPLGLSACQLSTPLDVPAWTHHEPRRVGWFVQSGLGNDHQADTTITFESNFGDVEYLLEPELVGQFGLTLGAEVFLAEDWSLQIGYAFRRFGAENVEPFEFTPVSSANWLLLGKWHVPRPFGEESRWRPVVQGLLSYSPNTSLETQHDQGAPGFPNPSFDFDGSPYWTVGLGVGLEYQMRSDLVFNVGVSHEWALDPTSDVVIVEFIPGFEAPLDTSIDPAGTTLAFGFTWFP